MSRRVLIVNVNWIGDVLFSAPFISAVRKAYPDGHIACLLHPRCMEMLGSNPNLDEVIPYDEEGRHKSLAGKFKLAMALRSRNFDTAFILHRSFTKALITYLAGVSQRIGYPTKNRGSLLTKTVEEPGGELHKIDYFLNIARFVGIDPADTRYEFFVKNEDRASVLKFFESENVTDKDILVALCPGGNWDPKRWPKENFALLGSLISKSAGARIAICGAKKDIGLAGEIASLMSVPPIIACGRTTLGQLGAVFERANLVVANDTGPMHIASAVGADVIALFGPTSARITGPRGRGRSVVISADVSCDVPCYDHTCKDYRCMSAITVEEVFCAAEKILIKKQ